MIQTIVRLTEKEKKNIEALAEATGRSQQNIMQEAIRRYLKKKTAQITIGESIIAARDELRGKD